MHYASRRTNLRLADPAIDLCQVPHRLEQRLHVFIRQSPDWGALAFKTAITRGESAVELMPEKQTEYYEPGFQGRKARQCADDFAPVQQWSLW